MKVLIVSSKFIMRVDDFPVGDEIVCLKDSLLFQ